jgi:hypothetical protein
MSKKTITATIVIMGIFILVLFGIVQDLNDRIYDNAEAIDAMKVTTPNSRHIDGGLFGGTVLPILKEIYYQDWVYVQENDDRWYDKDDVLLVYEDYSKGIVVVQFPDLLEDGHLYYDYEANVSNDWWQPMYNDRRSITFEQTFVDNFDDPASNDTIWREE